MATQCDSTIERDRIKLPGFGLPYNTWNEDDHYAENLSAVVGWSHPVLTIRECCMMFFLNRISDKSLWHLKVHDENIVTKWKKEVLELNWSKTEFVQGSFSANMFDYCIEELRHKAAVYEETGIIPVLDGNACVLKSDNAISAELKEELKRAVAPLEDVPSHQQDWHPGSNDQVLDLVHPSLFPLIYQRSRILPDSIIGIHDCLESIGHGEVVPHPTSMFARPSESDKLWSSRFQWLPCDVSFPDGENARIDSYINNLHPGDFNDLYLVIEKLITKAIPFWNIVCECHMSGSFETRKRIDCKAVFYHLPDGMQDSPPDDFDGYEDEYYKMVEEARIHDLPEPESFQSIDITAKMINDKFEFLGTGKKKIQVIVKLANIHLTPEKPHYEGGTWHIEGQLNEHIVATALYYYDSDNISDSHLSFRTKVSAEDFSLEIGYEQNDWVGLEKVFGVENEDLNIQELGSVLTREDRFIAFPNGLQHRVGKFKLADPTKPGHRKIVALFLVAPTIPIISTANVPPQQRDWWLREVKAGGSKVSNLPAELVDMIGEEVEDFPIGLAEAKALREELMVERGKMDKDVTDEMADDTFSFCEH